MRASGSRSRPVFAYVPMLLAVLIAPERGKVTGTMHEGPHFHEIGLKAVHEAIAKHEYFPNGWVIQFRNHPATLGQRRQVPRRFERALKHPKSIRARIGREVFDDFVERQLRRLGPDYPTFPRSHLRRISASTCSCGTARSSAISASPRANAWST